MPVDLVTVHHEAGAGKPPTDDIWRFSHGGYTFGVGNTVWSRFRSVEDSYATYNYNSVSVDICLSSDRHTVNEVTDAHIAMIHDAFMDAYRAGEVIAYPLVRAHRNSPGSATACPGDFTMDVWEKVARACSADEPEPEPEPEPPEDDMTDLASAINEDGRPEVFQVGADGNLYNRWREASGGNWSSWNNLSGGLSGFATVTAWRNQNGALEIWVTMRDGRTYQRWQTGAGWSDWNERTR